MNTRQQYQEAYRLQRACSAMAEKPHWMGASEQDLVRWYYSQIAFAKIRSEVENKAVRSYLTQHPQPSNWTRIQIKIIAS